MKLVSLYTYFGWKLAIFARAAVRNEYTEFIQQVWNFTCIARKIVMSDTRVVT
jgi:hypothetical protein